MAERDCPHNSGITCDGHTKCEKCGWFPPEEAQRICRVYDRDLATDETGTTYLNLKKKGGGKHE